jgi:hypothetical protein
VPPSRRLEPTGLGAAAVQFADAGVLPDDVRTAPAAAVQFLARQLDVAPVALDGYGVRTQTRTDHLNQVRSYLGFRSARRSRAARRMVGLPRGCCQMATRYPP